MKDALRGMSLLLLLSVFLGLATGFFPPAISTSIYSQERPGSLMLDGSTCPRYVSRGSDVNCTCFLPPDQLGWPPANVFWEKTSGDVVTAVPPSGDDVSTGEPSGADVSTDSTSGDDISKKDPSGDDVKTSAVLRVRQVGASDNGTVHRCRCQWPGGPDGPKDCGVVRYSFVVVGSKSSNKFPLILGYGIGVAAVFVIIAHCNKKKGSQEKLEQGLPPAQPDPTNQDDDNKEESSSGPPPANQNEHYNVALQPSNPSERNEYIELKSDCLTATYKPST